jgi:hypothetical protein
MADSTAVLDTTYWGDRLEISVELILDQHADDQRMATWLDGLTPRCLAILVERLRIPPDLSRAETRHAILAHRDALIPFLLAHTATAGKRSYAIVEVARAKLSASELARCQLQEEEDEGERFDRCALMWLLYLRDPFNLELVFHLDRIQRKGFACMVLDPAPGGRGEGHQAFFAQPPLQRILDVYEREKNTRRQSHCAAVLHDGGNYTVFIKRDYRPSFVARGAHNTFGFEREWIILDFEPDLHRVHVCSASPDVPLLLANRIASAFFGRSVAYTNEAIATSADTIAAFLQSLLADVAALPLVELTIQNSSLATAPQLRLNALKNASLAQAIRHFAAAFGSPLHAIRDIESLKVYAFGKRIKMKFEPGKDENEFVVRYADQSLNGKERRAFERRMAQDHGISILSTEKRYAR